MMSVSSPSQAAINSLKYAGSTPSQTWQGPLEQVAWSEADIQSLLHQIDKPCYIIRHQGQIGATQAGSVALTGGNGHTAQAELLLTAPSVALQNLGDPEFLTCHNTRYAYMTGAMAGGIASEEMVIALGKAKILGSFGTGGLPPARVESAIANIQQALPQGPYAFNLLHNPHDQAMERGTIDLYLKHGVRTVEASAFLTLTPNIVYYRAAGLGLTPANQIEIKNKIIAKVSRQEVAIKFMQPAPANMLKELVAQGLITEQQAHLAERVPMADDITVEADSGGHTDNRPLVCLLPAMLAIRDRVQAQYAYSTPVRIGAGGGIATPQSVLSTFAMGAAYVVTGSINQACIEAGTSEHTKQLLAQAEMADVMMAPAADMFEMGVRLQVLKKGTLFPMRAQKLYEIYKAYDSIEEIPAAEREKLETQVFRQNLDAVWQGTAEYLSQRDPKKLERALNNPKIKMAMIFRWYLGLSSRWSSAAEPGREIDYQIWCGPAMGAFNEWTKGSYLAASEHRRVVDVADQLMWGAGIAYRIQTLKMQGLQIPADYAQYCPTVPRS
jgi:PfaD family protein